jgi:hypothetical protein
VNLNVFECIQMYLLDISMYFKCTRNIFMVYFDVFIVYFNEFQCIQKYLSVF